MSAKCDAVGCERSADWAFVGEGGLYLCEFHGGRENVEGWSRVGDDRELTRLVTRARDLFERGMTLSNSGEVTQWMLDAASIDGSTP